MKNIFFIHWNEQELAENIRPLEKAGYKVGSHFRQETTADLKNNLPDVPVISLDRLPSHGRAYAEWMWEAKKRRHLPIIFCGGQADKVDTTRKKFPQAIYCTNEKLLATLEKLK